MCTSASWWRSPGSLGSWDWTCRASKSRDWTSTFTTPCRCISAQNTFQAAFFLQDLQAQKVKSVSLPKSIYGEYQSRNCLKSASEISQLIFMFLGFRMSISKFVISNLSSYPGQVYKCCKYLEFPEGVLKMLWISVTGRCFFSFESIELASGSWKSATQPGFFSCFSIFLYFSFSVYISVHVSVFFTLLSVLRISRVMAAVSAVPFFSKIRPHHIFAHTHNNLFKVFF